MKNKKIKKINVRISLKDYLTLRKDFTYLRNITPKNIKLLAILLGIYLKQNLTNIIRKEIKYE